MLHAEKGAEHIGIEGGGVAVRRLLGHRAGLALGAGAIDRRIETPEACNGSNNEVPHLLIVAHVGTDEFGFRAEGTQLRSQCLPGFLMPSGDDNSAAVLRESESGRPPDAGESARDQDDRIFHGVTPSARLIPGLAA